MVLPGSLLLPLKVKWLSQVFSGGSESTSSSSSSSSSTRPTGGVPGRPPREAPGAGHEGPGCPGAGAAAPEEDAAGGARELLAAVGERNCIHRRVPLARGLFTWAWESARAGASSGCGLGEGSAGAGEGASRRQRGRDGQVRRRLGQLCRSARPSELRAGTCGAKSRAGAAALSGRGPQELSSGQCGESRAPKEAPRGRKRSERATELRPQAPRLGGDGRGPPSGPLQLGRVCAALRPRQPFPWPV